MKNFLRLADGVNPIPILNALQAKPDLWNENKLRITHPLSPHQQTSDIWLMFNAIPEKVEDVVDDTIVQPYRAWNELPQVRPIIFDLMRLVEGTQLGRVLITRLQPGKMIPEHIDQGAPVEHYSRYQVALQSLPGALFKIDEETVNFKTGEVWRINNKQRHSVVNNSVDDRIVMIVDIHTC